jgi:hypothetical protein
MYNLLISLAVAIALGAGATLAFGGWLYAIIPFLLVFVLAYFLLARRSFRQVEAISREVGAIIEQASKQASGTRKQRQAAQLISAAMDRAIGVLRNAYKVGLWQFGVKSQIDAQIGQLLFMDKRFDQARPYLTTGFARIWTTRTMLAVCHFKGKEWAKMSAAFDEAMKNNKKQGIVYSVYAWCLMQAKSMGDASERQNKALAVLSQGKEATDGKDPILLRNLDAVRNGKKLNMGGYQQQWWMFHLEQPNLAAQRPQIRGR